MIGKAFLVFYSIFKDDDVLDIKSIYQKVVTPINDSVDKKWHFAPLISICLWSLFSIISIFTISGDVLSDPFVIFSIVFRILMPIPGYFFVKKFYYHKKITVLSYKHYLNYFGYSITLTYVIYMLPTVVKDFNDYGSTTLFPVIFTIICTLFPLALYLSLRNHRGKSNSGYFTPEEVEKEIKMKKDKILKKQNQKSLRRKRTGLQNLWFEIFDPFFWAIIWVLILHNFFFQLYEIPSSSMVPQFLEKDRVVATKFLKGPGIPLTRFNLPEVVKPQVGDIVTFKSPEINNPESNLHYKNVFTRIAQPFVFMLTLSKVDIDSDNDGKPKPRDLVKRVIGVPGEKISMVNDKVYKKVKGGEWTLMSEIPGQEEYGHNDLFSLTNRNSGPQFINPKLRVKLDKAANLVENSNKDGLEAELEIEKRKFIKNIEAADEQFYQLLNTYLNVKFDSKVDILNKLDSEYRELITINTKNIYLDDKKAHLSRHNKLLDDYHEFIYYKKVAEMTSLIGRSNSFYRENILTDVSYNSNPSPYEVFSKNLNALYLLKTLKLYNVIMDQNTFDYSEELESISKDLTLLSLYINGIFSTNETSYSSNFLNRLSFIPVFGSGNLPEFPKGEGNYIPEGEYFLLGDNRYNSMDSRMGDSYDFISLDGRETLFSQNVLTAWDPHTYNEKYILGRARFVVWPLNRFQILF